MTGLETLEQIAQALDVPLSHFVEGYARRQQPSRARLQLENELTHLAATLSDQDFRSAIDIINIIAKRGTS